MSDAAAVDLKMVNRATTVRPAAVPVVQRQQSSAASHGFESPYIARFAGSIVLFRQWQAKSFPYKEQPQLYPVPAAIQNTMKSGFSPALGVRYLGTPSVPYYLQDQTRLQGVSDRVKFEMMKHSQRPAVPQQKEFQFVPAKKKTKEEQLYSDLMVRNDEWIKKYYPGKLGEHYRSTGAIMDPYVESQLYLLKNKSPWVRLTDPISPVNLLNVVGLIGKAKGVGSPPGVVRFGMTSRRDRVPNSYNTTLVVKPKGPLLRPGAEQPKTIEFSPFKD